MTVKMEFNQSMKGNLYIFVTAFLWSFIGIAIKLTSYHGMTVVGITSLMAVLVLVIYNRKKVFTWNRMTLLTGLVTALMNITFYLANKYTTVSNVIVLQYCSPVFVALYGIFILRRKMNKQQLLTIVICMIGLLIFFAGQLDAGNLLGNMLALTSGVLFAGTFILSTNRETNPICASIVSHLICVVAGFGFTLTCLKQTFDLSQVLFLVMTGVVLSGVSSIFYSLGIKYTTALNANMIALSEVFMAPLWSFLIFNERMGTYAAIGAVLMILSIIYETYMERNREEYEDCV